MSPARNRISQLLAGTATGADWNSLRLLNSYRLFIAIVLLIGFIASPGDIEFGQYLPMGFYVAGGLYIVAALAFAVSIHLRRPAASTQAHLQLYADILILAFATYTSGGVASGLGVLMVVPVAGAGMLLPFRHGLLFAALATLLLLGGELGHHMDAGGDASHFAQGALLGAALFVSATLAGLLARRSALSAELAERRSRDVRNLSALNERIIQQMESGLLVVDHHDRIVLANASAAELLGDGEHLEGEPLSTIAPGIRAAMSHWRKSGQPPAAPVTPDAPARREPIRLQLQFTDLGELGTLISLEDAAFIEEQLQQLKLASLGRLTASIAHEVRNPLGAISHATQLLAESPGLSGEDTRFTRIILDHCRRVNSIVDNVLQLSRRQSVDAEPLALGPWLEDFAHELRDHQGLDEDRCRLAIDSDPGPVAIDPEHLHQVVGNLCDNALTHGQRDDGRPIRLLLRATRDDRGLPTLDIEDDGQPIDPARIEEIFEPFVSSRHGGTGLGLFLARELCEANGARLRYRAGDAGNCFRIHLRAADADRTRRTLAQ